MKQLEEKIIELDPEKEYVIIVGRAAGITADRLKNIPAQFKKCMFLLVDDVNQIKIEELQEFEAFIKKHKT